MQLRIARHTAQLETLVAFYRDGIGLPEVGRFSGHAGYDGVFLDIPGSRAHLELTAGEGHPPTPPHPEALLVLYLGDEVTLALVAARLDAPTIKPVNPYWQSVATTYADPDGHAVVLVPTAWAA